MALPTGETGPETCELSKLVCSCRDELQSLREGVPGALVLLKGWGELFL